MNRPATTRRVTAADVARSLGISRATVGFVLNDTPGQTISEATRQRVQAEARRLGYRPHTVARALASGQTRIILLVLPDWPLDYSMRTHLDEASLTLDEAGYSLVTTTPHPGGHARPLWESLNPDVVIGLTPFTDDQLEQLRRSGIRHVVPPIPATAAEFGMSRYADGPRFQVEHLVERGHRRLAFAGSTDRRLADLVDQRRTLARDTAESIPGVTLLAEAAVDQESAPEQVQGWVDQGIDGVVAYNDDIAAMVCGAAVRAGLPVPGRLAVIGHDDAPIARLFVPALSTVRIDAAGLGRYLAQLALSSANGTAPPTAGPEADAVVVARETT